MNEEQSLKEFQLLIQRVVEAETNDFFELANILGRDPKRDLAGANLSAVNLRGGDLENANLRSTDLSGADLSYANLSGADLSDADLSNANFSGADLSGANLSNASLSGTDLSRAKVENAWFKNNLGLDEAIKLDLKRRRAVVSELRSESQVYVQVYKPSIAGFLKYAFLGKRDEFEHLVPIVEIAELSDVPEEQKQKLKPPFREQIINSLIVPINWVLAIVCLGSFSVMIIYAFFFRGETIPEPINNAFLTTIGWFGGALTTYLSIKQN